MRGCGLAPLTRAIASSARATFSRNCRPLASITGSITSTWSRTSKRSIGPPVALTEVLDQKIGYHAEQESDVDPVASESGNQAGSVDLTMAAGASGNAQK